MFNFLDKLKSKSKDIRIGNVFITEVLPVFCDRSKTTNKNLYYVEKGIDTKTITASKIPMLGVDIKTRHTMFYDQSKIITQDNIPIKIYGSIKRIKCNFDFEKFGFKKNQIYKFLNRGYLGEMSFEYRVKLVTDQFIFFEDLGSKNVHLLSYEELKRSCIELLG